MNVTYMTDAWVMSHMNTVYDTWMMHVIYESAQEWTNRAPNATNKSIPHFLLLQDSESSFTEISEYVYFSLI